MNAYIAVKTHKTVISSGVVKGGLVLIEVAFAETVYAPTSLVAFPALLSDRNAGHALGKTRGVEGLASH